MRKSGTIQALANFVWSTTPFIVSGATFIVFTLIEKKALTAAVAFPAIALFNLLTFPLAVLPMVISAITEASVAVSRIEKLLSAEELQLNAVTKKTSESQIDGEAVSIKDAVFSWDREKIREDLVVAHFAVPRGEFCCIIGRVGSGKSSLLHAIIGEMWKIRGEVVLCGSVAFVAQSPWVLNASVKENILFGHKWDRDFYDVTIEACALRDDLSIFPQGEDTLVGDQGLSLSGGQKARLSLARAVYARADVYLLDDCLSAVDQHIGRHLIEKVLGRNGILRCRTRILATNSILVLEAADSITVLRDGKVIEQKTASKVKNDGEITSFLPQHSNGQELVEEEPTLENAPGDGQHPDSSNKINSKGSEVKMEGERSSTNTRSAKSMGMIPGDEIRSIPPARRTSFTYRKVQNARYVQKSGGKASLMQTRVKWEVYLKYFHACRPVSVGFLLVALLASQASSLGGNIWIKIWTEATQRSETKLNVGRYIGIYLAFGFGSAFLVAIEQILLWMLCSIQASNFLCASICFFTTEKILTFDY